jgi:hypothetical protein
MCLNQLLHDVGSQLQEVLWDDVPRRDLSAQSEQLENLLEEAEDMLEAEGSIIEELRRRLADKGQQADWLFERVEVYLHVGDQNNAWRHALDLDQLRTTLESERQQLQRHRHFYQDKLAKVRRLRGRLADLQEQL